jgi:hypothetical protein
MTNEKEKKDVMGNEEKEVPELVVGRGGTRGETDRQFRFPFTPPQFLLGGGRCSLRYSYACPPFL